MSSAFKQFYEFGPYSLDVSERMLMRGGRPVRLTPKEFETLLALVRGGGRVMSKEELLKEVWPATFVGEATLAQNVFTLRKALGEAEGGGPFIETVPRRGYRFAVKVTERRAAEPPPAQSPGDENQARAFTGPRLEDEGRAPLRPHAPDAATPHTDAATRDPGLAPAESVHPNDPASVHANDPADDEHARQSPASRASQASQASQAARTAESANGYARSDALPSTPAGEAPAADSRRAGGHPARAAVLIALLVFGSVAALVYVIYRLSVRPDVERARGPARDFQSMRVTRLPVNGSVTEAAISPDGNYLAYISAETGRPGAGIWVRQVAAASNTQQLVAPAEGTDYGGLVFSPDSQHVYYGAARQKSRTVALSRVPVLGGPAEKVLEAPFDEVSGGPLTFSPDGRRLAYVRGGYGRETTLVVSDLSGANRREVVAGRLPEIFGLPAWSPDGETIACAYGSADAVGGGAPSLGVKTFRLSDGAELRVTEPRWVDVRQLSWLPDGSGLVVSATEQELSPAQIWLLSVPAGETRRVTNDLNTYLGASVTADGSALVTVQTDRAPNIWVAPGGDTARARQITTGSGKFDGYYGLSWAPDGRVVYASAAGGSWDIWAMNADGTGAKQLTVGARSNYGPSVSADGRRIVFVSNRAGGAFNVWRMDADGSNPLRLTSGRGENFPHVTPDGRWVVYATVGAGQEAAVWKVPIDGGEPTRLTRRPASWPFVSPDGKSFVCTYGEGPYGEGRLAVVPIEGGEPTRLYDVAPTFRANTVWLPDNRGIAYLDARSGATNVWMQPLSGGKPVQLTDFAADYIAAFDWSRDNRLVATRSVETTGVVLIRDFR
ncbi:MAG TPA: winged helix-turn-helix domain-containing protein [Pyrinomonadaceae bacterium]|jgi:Tol biopolymer transport system component/DNA-binding winged helix-turn-helix (wHTH) protein